MRVENGKLVYATTTCWTCNGTGAYRPNHPCPRYDRPQNGQPCPHCGSTTKHGHHYLPDGQDVTCGRCQGTGKVPENRYDYLPSEIVTAIPLVVVRSNRAITFNESYLGIGCLWSSVDYGAHRRLSDEALAEKIRSDMSQGHSVQACHVVDKEDRLPPFIAICCNNQGYSVRSAWELPQLLQEWDVETGMLVGTAVYRAGGHGTLAAAIGKPVR